MSNKVHRLKLSFFVPLSSKEPLNNCHFERSEKSNYLN